jgi:hypothetical protein
MVHKRRYSMTLREVEPWIQRYECVQRYLNSLHSFKERTATYLYLFCEWAGKNPGELLAVKDSFQSTAMEDLLDRFVYVKVDYNDNLKRQMIMATKGFFRRNHKPLTACGELDFTPKKEPSCPKPEKMASLFKEAYTPRDKALLAVVCSGIALDSLTRLRFRYFEENWQQQELPCVVLPAELLKGHGRGKYKGVKQVTFLTPEARRLVVEYRGWYTKTFGYVWSDDSHVFLQIKSRIGEPLKRGQIDRIFRVISGRVGVKLTPHDGRRLLQTALQNVSCSPDWIQIFKGRKVSGSQDPYTKPTVENMRGKFREALPYLQFLAESGLDVVKGEAERLKVQNAELLTKEYAQNQFILDTKRLVEEMQRKQAATDRAVRDLIQWKLKDKGK